MNVCANIPFRKISAFVGLAGGTTGDYKQQIYEFLRKYNFGCINNGSDVQNAVAGALGDKDGIVVIMGTGEPLQNTENVIGFIERANSDMGIGWRRITVSTCGIVPGIDRLIEWGRPINLAISLHAPTDDLRSQIMPINNRYKLDEVLEAAWRFTDLHNRQLMIEYILLGKRDENGETVLYNATPEYAEKLSELLRGKNCMVNLIPWNAVDERDFASPSGNAVHRFQDILIKNGVHTRIRRERGTDIGAAGGQLRLNNARNKK
jgi:23S rRNA (adenine2503-C2)-methyltransferase